MTTVMRALIFIFLLIFFDSCKQGNISSSGNIAALADSDELNVLNEVSGKKDISVLAPFVPDEKITVGGNDADIHGFDSEAIQIAIEALRSRSKGGTVILQEGNYDINAPVRLYDNISLSGTGPKTILRKCKGFRTSLLTDADYGELHITVIDASGFRNGMGIAIYDDSNRTGWDLTTARITRITGNTIYIDDYLQRDYHAENNGAVSNNFSVISAVDADNIRITGLVADGAGESNDKVDGCRAGGIYLHKAANAVVENVVVRNFSGDGISWQLTEHVTVRNCEVYGCTNSGLHPGTGSLYTLIEGNKSYNNEMYGLFVCWRVSNGVVRNNIFHNNGVNGISTGHKDTDMQYSGNHIYENGWDGIYLRRELDQNAPHRSVFRNNLIENNGMKERGYGIAINCKAQGVVLENNIFRNTGKGKQAAAVFLSENSLPVEMMNNEISHHPEGDIVNLKK